MNVKKDIRFRVYIAFTCICLMGLAIIIKAAVIQTKEGAELRRQAFNMHMRTDTMYAERGNIYTEDGHLLCSSIPQFDIHLDMTVIKVDSFNKYVDTISRAISYILPEKSYTTYKTELTHAFRDSARYYFLAKNVPYDKYQELRGLPIFKRGKRKGGFIAESKIKRINPYGMLAYRTIGLWRENGAVGLEAKYDSLLQGENGHRVVQKMTGGVDVPIEGSEIEPQNGYDIVSTLDLGIQNVAEHSLLSVLEQYECLNGTAIVMEVQTGKIRALVNLGRNLETGRYFEDQNYAMTRAEPGSTFKLMTLLSLLNDGYINVDDIVNCNGGAYQFGKRTMHDSHHGLGAMPIWQAYAHSSNVGMAYLAYTHYFKDPAKYVKHLEDFGIDKRTGIDILGEQKPTMIKPGSKHWNTIATLPWMATGYGVLITPLRTCMMYNAIANGGKLMKPYLISSIREYGKDIKKFEPTVLKEHLGDSSTIAQLQKCTRMVVEDGTGKSIRSPYYQISGKTGTAQVADMIGGRWYGYKDAVYQGSFVGYFPSDKPKYTMMVMIRTKPHGGSYYGGLIAAPVFRMIADKIFATGMGSWAGPLDSIAHASKLQLFARQATGQSYKLLLQSLGLKIKSDSARVNGIASLSVDSNKNISLKEKAVIKGQVPDVVGMGLRDAVYLLENAGLHVQVQGSGTVTAQSIAPGSVTVRGQSILLQLI